MFKRLWQDNSRTARCTAEWHKELGDVSWVQKFNHVWQSNDKHVIQLQMKVLCTMYDGTENTLVDLVQQS